MTKYAPLSSHLASYRRDEWRVSFADMERLLGFRLPNAARTHRAWWSNNGSNNVMTTAWLRAGWRTEQVDMSGERLVFRRSMRVEPPRDETASAIPSLVGALRGTVRFHSDIESTEERWNADAADAPLP